MAILFKTVALAATLFSQAASAETWLCTYTSGNSSPFSSTLTLAGNLLIERPYDTRYRILENNRYAIIAEDHYAAFDPILSEPSIFISTILLEKARLHYTQTIALSGSPAKQWTGTCREWLNPSSLPSESAIAGVADAK